MRACQHLRMSTRSSTHPLAPRTLGFLAGLFVFWCTTTALAGDWAPLRVQLDDTLRRTVIGDADLHVAEILSEHRAHLHGSLSAGNTSHGHLVDATALPQTGPHHYVLREHRDRGTHWGTRELVEGLLRAAEHVSERFPGTRTGIGNLSMEEGGDIRWSVSHNTGRDADVAFFFVDGRGAAVEVPTLLHVDADGRRAKSAPYELDLPRSWAFVQYLVRDPELRVQWIFVSEAIRRRLLAYADEHGATSAVMEAAAAVLRQPANALPHDDHFHVRVHCAPDDRLDGCVEWGPRHAHIHYPDDAVRRRARALLRAFLHGDEASTAQSYEYLSAMEPREAAADILAAVDASTGLKRMPLLRLAAAQGGDEVIAHFEAYLDAPMPHEELRYVIRALGGLASPSSAPSLAALAKDDARPLELRVAALDALQANMVVEALLPLAALFREDAEELREAAFRLIARLTLFGVDAGHPPEADAWTQWKAARGPQEAEAWEEARWRWLSEGFERAGYAIGNADAPQFSELLRALSDEREAIAWNADRLLARWTGIYASAHRFDAEQKTRFWRRALRRR